MNLMQRNLPKALIVTLILALVFSFPGRNANAMRINNNPTSKSESFVDDEVLVRFDSAVPPDRIQRLLLESNADVVSEIGVLDIRILKAPRGDVETVIFRLRRPE
jgi:hypothetical protein